MDNKTLKRALAMLDQRGSQLEALTEAINELEHYIEEQNLEEVKRAEDKAEYYIRILLNNISIKL